MTREERGKVCRKRLSNMKETALLESVKGTIVIEIF